jgi:CheY-like chemotaxis protein
MAPLVLIVDDENINLFLHKAFIIKSGLNDSPVCFCSGLEAYQYLNLHHVRFEHCLILLDLNMPLMTGWQFLTILENSYFKAKLKVVILSSSMNATDLKKANKSPLVIHYLEKPLTLEKCREIAEGVGYYSSASVRNL